MQLPARYRIKYISLVETMLSFHSHMLPFGLSVSHNGPNNRQYNSANKRPNNEPDTNEVDPFLTLLIVGPRCCHWKGKNVKLSSN